MALCRLLLSLLLSSSVLIIQQRQKAKRLNKYISVIVAGHHYGKGLEVIFKQMCGFTSEELVNTSSQEWINTPGGQSVQCTEKLHRPRLVC